MKNTQRLVSDGKATLELPQRLDEIFTEKLLEKWTRPDGQPFESFVQALKHQQPFGLGFGQYRYRMDIEKVYHLCTGFSELQRALRPLLGDKLPTLAEHGTNQHSENGGGDYNVMSSQQGNSQEYLLGRLKRDSPEIFERWKAGEFASVRSAAMAAGIIKPKRLEKDICPLMRLQQYWKKATKKQRTEVLAWIEE